MSRLSWMILALSTIDLSAPEPHQFHVCWLRRDQQDQCVAEKQVGRAHPRVRGEQAEEGGTHLTIGGSPPRARGEGVDAGAAVVGGGIPPACAGNRAVRCRAAWARPDHPACAGSRRRRSPPTPCFGITPRVLGEQLMATNAGDTRT